MRYANQLIVVVFIFLFGIFALMGMGEEAINNNPNLNSQSQATLSALNSRIGSNFSDLTVTSINVSQQGVDPQEAEFRERSAESSNIVSFTKKITLIPDIILLGLDLPVNVFSRFMTLIAALISIYLTIIAFNAFFGGGKITRN